MRALRENRLKNCTTTIGKQTPVPETTRTLGGAGARGRFGNRLLRAGEEANDESGCPVMVVVKPGYSLRRILVPAE
jgi:hypothetical protein